MRFLYQQVAALQSVFVGISGEFVDDVLPVEIVCQGHHRFEVVELEAVVIRVSEGKLKDETAYTCLFEIRCHSERVFGYEDVGCDAAAAVNYTPYTGVIGWTGVLDAILIEEFAVLVTCDEVLLIILVVAVDIRLLYASARWRVITGDGQANHTAV